MASWAGLSMRQLFSFLAGPLDGSAALEVSSHQPAERCPDKAGGPAGQDVRGIMNAKVDAADAHNEGHSHRNSQHVKLEAPLGHQTHQQAGERQVDYGGEE